MSWIIFNATLLKIKFTKIRLSCNKKKVTHLLVIFSTFSGHLIFSLLVTFSCWLQMAPADLTQHLLTQCFSFFTACDFNDVTTSSVLFSATVASCYTQKKVLKTHCTLPAQHEPAQMNENFALSARCVPLEMMTWLVNSLKGFFSVTQISVHIYDWNLICLANLILQ